MELSGFNNSGNENSEKLSHIPGGNFPGSKKFLESFLY